MKRLNILILSTLIAAGLSMQAQAGIAVIVHPDNPNTLDASQVRKIFLAKVRSFPDGSEVLPIDQEVGTEARNLFVSEVLKKDEGNLNSYWARMLFSSKGKPPKVINNAAEMKALIAGNKNAIGYINSEQVDSSVKVLVTIP